MAEATQARYDNPEDVIWDTYLKASKHEDETRPKNWEGSTTGILTFTGLFAATVAAFIIESYKLLSPDPSDRTNALLEQLFIAMANTSSNSPVIVPATEPFSVPISATITNSFWFSSLLISLICAMLSTLVQEWSRNYVQDINRHTVLHESLRDRAFNHIYIRMGVDRYGMDQFVSWIVALVQLAVVLFACGLVVFLFSINSAVAAVSSAVLGTSLVIYVFVSLLPLSDRSCPYRTPVSYIMAFLYYVGFWCMFMILRIPWDAGSDFRNILTREHSGFALDFLTDERSSFMWEHTIPHVGAANSLLFLKGLSSLIGLHKDHAAFRSRLCADPRFIYDILRSLLSEQFSLEKDGHRTSASAVDPWIYRLIAKLSERMFVLEVEHHGEHLEIPHTSSMLLKAIGDVLRIAELKGPSHLFAQCCLAYVRRSLLVLSSRAYEKNMDVVQDSKVWYLFNDLSSHDFRLGNHHPIGILLLLITGSYSRSEQWGNSHESCLVPLHKDSCCADWRHALTRNGLAHVAACNALSLVAFILDSPDDQRTHPDEFLLRTIWGLEGWDKMLKMPQEEKRMPSTEFVALLRLAGLDEWMEPGSSFDSKPREGPHRGFLTRTPLGKEIPDVLRALARHVDFAAYRERPPTPPPDALHVPNPDSIFLNGHNTTPDKAGNMAWFAEVPTIEDDGVFIPADYETMDIDLSDHSDSQVNAIMLDRAPLERLEALLHWAKTGEGMGPSTAPALRSDPRSSRDIPDETADEKQQPSQPMEIQEVVHPDTGRPATPALREVVVDNDHDGLEKEAHTAEDDYHANVLRALMRRDSM
ncbi:unnamed protein product [Peniophora sp. CBMAI 1063]|nr:unnamed protein product [Peniophora sp. CBMAI 1063]